MLKDQRDRQEKIHEERLKRGRSVTNKHKRRRQKNERQREENKERRDETKKRLRWTKSVGETNKRIQEEDKDGEHLGRREEGKKRWEEER